MASMKGGSISRIKAPTAGRAASRSTKPLRLLSRSRKKDRSRQARGESAARRAQGGGLKRGSRLLEPPRHLCAPRHRKRPSVGYGRMSAVNHDILAVDERGAVARKKHRGLR